MFLSEVMNVWQVMARPDQYWSLSFSPLCSDFFPHRLLFHPRLLCEPHSNESRHLWHELWNALIVCVSHRSAAEWRRCLIGGRSGGGFFWQLPAEYKVLRSKLLFLRTFFKGCWAGNLTNFLFYTFIKLLLMFEPTIVDFSLLSHIFTAY